MNDFQWFADRLDIARWNDETSGQRDVHAACPVCGGSDPLHVSEKNGKALLNCFSCGAGYGEVVEALESEDDETVQSRLEIERLQAPVTVRRGRRERSAARAAETPANADDGGSTPPASTTPLQWAADRCSLSMDELTSLGLPLGETDDAVVFEFPEVRSRKLRVVGDGKKKVMAWSGPQAPPLWPMPTSPEGEIVVCEGEFDAICLRHSGYDAYSVTKGAKGEVPAVVWEALRAAGVRRVRLAFDLDEDGRKGRLAAAEAARAAGLDVRESRVAGIRPLEGEKDARDVAVRAGYPLVLEDDADEDDAVPLSEVERAPREDLLLGRLHPQEHTILFGDGGTGKGVIAAWWVAQLTRDYRMRVLIADYEQHARHEWRPRVEDFGGDLDMVRIVQPTAKPIWEIAGWLRSQIEKWQTDYLVVDSVLYACVGHEAEKSATAIRYSLGIATLQVPVLSLAHVPKGTPDPNHPFGSTFWSAGARLTIAVSRQDPEDLASPRIVRAAKTNQRAPFSAVAIRWDSWLGNDKVGDPIPGAGYNTLTEMAAYRSAAEATRELHALLGRVPTVQEVEDAGFKTTPNAISVAISKTKHVNVRRTSGGKMSEEDED